MPRTRLADLLAWLSLLAMPLAAQQELQAARGRLAGWVRDTDGKRVIGANVTLLSRPIPGRPDLGTLDLVQVTTDADGMFRSELLHSQAYSAWATWRDPEAAEQGGTQHRTKVLEGVFPGPPRQLAQATAQSLRKLTIVGVAAWQDRAPLTTTIFTSSDNVLGIPVPLNEHHELAVPTLPGNWCSVEVRDRTGFLLAILTNQRLDSGPAHQELRLPAPKPYRAIVLDDKGKPIAGALVRHDFGHHHRDLSTAIGKTNERGQLAMSIPSSNLMYNGDTHAGRLLVEAPGRQRVLAWINFQDAATKTERRIQLRKGPALTGQILDKYGKPPRGITLLPDCYAMGSEQEHTGVGVPLRAVPLDEQGRFSFTSLHPHYDFRLLACIDAQAARDAGMALRPGVAFAPVIWLAVGRPAAAGPHDLGEMRLDKIPIAQVRVTTHDGVPVPGAHLSLTTKHLYNSPIDYVCDRVGRLQVPLPKGSMRIGAWTKEHGIATMLVHTPAAGETPAEDAPSINPLQIQLSATRTVHGVVVDVSGKPVAGTTVRQWNRPKIENRILAELAYKAATTSDLTGTDGKFTLTLPLDDAAFAVRCYGKVDGTLFGSDEILIAADEGHEESPVRITVAPVNVGKDK